MVRRTKNNVTLAVMPLFVPGEDPDRVLSEQTKAAAVAVAPLDAEPHDRWNAVVSSPSMGQVSGSVVDETGAPLGGFA